MKQSKESREYPQRPFAGVGVVVFRNDEVLLIRRGTPPRAGEWSLPGGIQHTGETVEEAAHREVLEETGVMITSLRFLEVIDAIIPDNQGRVRFHYTIIDFQAEWESGEVVAGDDASHSAFVPLSEIDDLGLWEKTVEVIRRAHAQR